MAHLVNGYRGTEDGERHHTEEKLETVTTAEQPKLVLEFKKRGVAGRTVSYVLPRFIFDEFAPSRDFPHDRVAGASLTLRIGEVSKNRVLDGASEAFVSLFRRVFHLLMDIMPANRPFFPDFHSSIFLTDCFYFLLLRGRESV